MYGRLWLSLLVSTATTCTLPAFAGTSNTDYFFIVDQVRDNCQQFGAAYQEIGSFETANFYVNLCALGNRYFYLGTAKNKSYKSNFIPAYPTDQINTYQADNGNSSYIVKIEPTQATLIIQRNNKTILVETGFTQNCPQVSYEEVSLRSAFSGQSTFRSQVQFSPELNYSEDRVALISDRYSLYTSSNNLPNQLEVTGITQSKVFTFVPNEVSLGSGFKRQSAFDQPSSFSHCF